MFNLNIPTKDDIRENLEETVQKHEDAMVIGGTIAGTAACLGLMYLIYSKSIEHGVAKGFVKGYRLIR